MIIYGLSDPRTSELRYVGRTKRKLNVRLQQHLQPAYLKPNTHKNAWVKSLLSDGIKPEIFEIETTEDFEAEEFWIAYFKSLGCNLTNGTKGGEGWKAGMKHSEESRKRISLSHLGKKRGPQSLERRTKTSEIMGGKKFKDNLGRIFNTIPQASKELGISIPQIWRVLKGQSRSTHNLKFSYLEVI